MSTRLLIVPGWVLVVSIAACGGDPKGGDQDAGTDAMADAALADADVSVVDAAVDAAVPDGGQPAVCNTCHGDTTSSAPPTDTLGNVATTERGVGAHRSHLKVDTGWHRNVECTDCHVVPTAVNDVGHNDTALPAELTWGAVATSDGATPSFDGATTTCNGVYCHGATLYSGGTNTTPNWTDGIGGACGTCHSIPPAPPHPANLSCSTCHPIISADFTWIAPERHIDGIVDVQPGVLTCTTCHGTDGESAAPPRDTTGNTDTTARGVGAHRSHLGPSTWHKEIMCDSCHVVPSNPSDAGHNDSAWPAELTWSSLPLADGATPSFDGATTTCTGVYCHGATLLVGGSNTTPNWTSVGTGEAACGTCHSLPPGGSHPVIDTSGPLNCSPCHDYTGTVANDPDKHINGTVEVAACGACHSIPPATGAHATHYGDTSAPPLAGYGDTRVVADYYPSGASYYMFGCGNCHPLDPSKHADGTVQVELHDPTAAIGSPKSLSPNTAAFAGNTCSDVYCHSSGQETPTYVTTPDWLTGTLPAPRCGACHGNPPAYPSGGAGTPTANLHVVMADDGYELGHFGGMPGPWHTSYHGRANQGASPITCQTCHYQTVDASNVGPGGYYYLDTSGNYDLGGQLNYACDTCHDGMPTSPAQLNGGVSTALHVNGSRDVIFDPRTSIPGTVTGLPAAPNRPTYPYWVTATPGTLPPNSTTDGSTWSLHLAGALYDPATKGCSNIPCHLSQSWGPGPSDPLLWGVTPVGNSTCNACHQF